MGRDPWFDRLTTLSEAEGESRKVAENQIVLDLPPISAGDDEFLHVLQQGGFERLNSQLLSLIWGRAARGVPSSRLVVLFHHLV